jgi:hypothetical protein
MKSTPRKTIPCEEPLKDSEFLKSYNANMPEGYPLVSLAILNRFKKEHPFLFKNSEFWTLDRHRKHMIMWLPQNI